MKSVNCPQQIVLSRNLLSTPTKRKMPPLLRRWLNMVRKDLLSLILRLLLGILLAWLQRHLFAPEKPHCQPPPEHHG
jgi:hypothetical protein